jgi:hypothetical protein
MDGFLRQVLAKVPLAEAVLTLASFALAKEPIEEVYEENRGRTYTGILRFPEFVQVLWSCLSLPWKSARAGLLKAETDGTLSVTSRAFYDKLAGIPVDVTLAFFRSCLQRLEAAFPREWEVRPGSLAEFEVLLMDGKVIKHVPRNRPGLRMTMVNACKLLGGRALVVVQRWTNIVRDLEVDLDGEANEVKLVPALMQRVGQSLKRAFLIVGDRAFGIFEVCRTILEQGGQFVLRKHGNTRFEADSAHAAVTGTDRFGRTVSQEWGSILRGKDTKAKACERLEVRQITVRRDKDDLVLITSLLDEKTYPVDDLLDAYLERWDIEGVFQTVTEVFHLNDLFSTSPQGMLFQLAYCFLMYDMIQIVKLYIAHHQEQPEESISSEMLFRDIQEEVIAVARLMPPDQIAEMIPEPATPQILRDRLSTLLKDRWYKGWRKANYRPRDPSKPKPPKPPKIKQTKSHDSVYRILQRSP